MKRDLYDKLLKWKNNPHHSPLILKGARHVGKTWLLKEFGKSEYKNVAYVNLEDPKFHKLFLQLPNIDHIISSLSLLLQQQIKSHSTLLILDEIQNCPQALTSLKYFKENAPEFHVVAAGSHLGLGTSYGTGFPVGKVEFLNLYPLSFLEFLSVLKEDQIKEALCSLDLTLTRFFIPKIRELLQLYYLIGGMPAVINEYISTHDLSLVRNKQRELLDRYELELSRMATAREFAKIKMVWNSVASQLLKENDKFMFNLLKKGARASEFANAIRWLEDYGLIRKVTNISKPAFPINCYENLSFFKLYPLDLGLLGAMTQLDLNIFSYEDHHFEHLKKILHEQFVLQELIATDHYRSMHYWISKSHVAKVDFIVQDQEKIIPIEVNDLINPKSKSLKQYRLSYDPKISVRTTPLANFEIDLGLFNIPLYAIGLLHQIIEKYDPK